VIAKAPICATPYYQNKEATIQAGLADGSLHSPTLSDLGRKLHALFLVRMLGVVALLMIVVAWGMIG